MKWKEILSKKYEVILFLTILFGFILRLINVNTKIVLGDPPHFIVHAKNFLSSGLLVTWDQSNFLWHSFTDIFFKMFGLSQFASRFSSLFFGTLTIIAIYLFAKKFFESKRIALISAMLVAFMPTFVFNTADELDTSVIFFIVLTFYCLIKGLKDNSKNYLLFSAMLFGISCMWKAYVPILIIPYAGMIAYYSITKRFDIKTHYKIFAIAIAVILLIVSPTLVYNTLNYKHNGVTDYLFTKFLKTWEGNQKLIDLYGWTAGGDLYKSFSFYSLFVDAQPDNPDNNASLLFTGLRHSLFSHGAVLCAFLLISLIFLWGMRKKEIFAKDYLIFYLLYFIVPFLFLIEGNTLSKHFIHFFILGIPPIAYFLDKSYSFASMKSEKIKIFFSKYTYLFYALLTLFVFFVLFSFAFFTHDEAFYYSNPEGKLIDYKLDNISPSSFIIYDDRIYNSLAGWLFNDRYYIPASLFEEFMNYNKNSNRKMRTAVYFVECGIDDCGWGTISSNPPLNNSMESFFMQIKNNSIPMVFSVKEKLRNIPYYNFLFSSQEPVGDYFKVYKSALDIDLDLAAQIKAQYSNFLYPIGYENKNSALFKNFIYAPSGLFEELINDLAWLMFYLDILISIIAILFLFYEFYFTQ